MPTDAAASYVSPFESRQWERWTNPERLQWLRGFYLRLKKDKKKIDSQFKLDPVKLKRLEAAVGILDSVCKQELEMLEKRIAYNEAMHNLAMDELLKSPTFGKRGIFPGARLKPRDRSGN
jgi:hypothetical protein